MLLDEEIAEIDAQLAAAGADDESAQALQEMTDAVQTLTALLSDAPPAVPATDATDAEAAPAPPTDVQRQASEARFEQRRVELLGLLQATAERGDDDLRERAEDLIERVEELKFQADGDAPNAEALRAGLAALDDLLRAVGTVQDSEARLEAAQVAVLREFAVQRVSGGLSPEEFDERRRELLSLLDTLQSQGDEALQRRVEDVRRRVVALRPGTTGDADLRRLRDEKGRLRERIALELELGGEGGPATAAPIRNRRAFDDEIERLTRELDARARIPRTAVAASTEEREARVRALESVLVPCLKCHELSGPKLAPVTAAEPVMPRSIFTHRPHVIATDCAACHASVDTSGLATDVNVPGVDSCQRCHAPSETRADCATCHIYHPPSVARLLRAF